MKWLYLFLAVLWLAGWLGTCWRFHIMRYPDWISQAALIFFTWPAMILMLGVKG